MLTVKEFVEKFNKGFFDAEETQTDVWYDWFCKDTSLVKKTERLGRIIVQISKCCKIKDSFTISFANVCPMAGGLFDRISIGDENGEKIEYCIDINSPRTDATYLVYMPGNELVEIASIKELVAYFNDGLELYRKIAAAAAAQRSATKEEKTKKLQDKIQITQQKIGDHQAEIDILKKEIYACYAQINKIK